ncbi:MAG: thiamine phosphate synthase [Novosphingobium sp.]
MARCYSDAVSKRYPPFPSLWPCPLIWLVSDARNDAALEAALDRLPRGSGLVFRHYHLSPQDRRARFNAVWKVAKRRGHTIFLAADARTARAWRADGAYGSAQVLASGPALPRLVTAHSVREMHAARADAFVLSPVFATRSHPGSTALGPVRFRLMSRNAPGPVIALGGMTAKRAAALGSRRWAAIDGLSSMPGPRILDEESP